MPEIVGTFARTELWDERANCSSEARNSSRRDLTEERLEFAVRQFDWIEVGRVFRQVAQRRVRFLNGLANGGPHAMTSPCIVERRSDFLAIPPNSRSPRN